MTKTEPTVSFVDDEVGILDGLFRRFSVAEEPWNMLFASSGSRWRST